MESALAVTGDDQRAVGVVVLEEILERSPDVSEAQVHCALQGVSFRVAVLICVPEVVAALGRLADLTVPWREDPRHAVERRGSTITRNPSEKLWKSQATGLRVNLLLSQLPEPG